jgi:hypothetical protein
VSVLRSAYPNDSLDQTKARMTSLGDLIIDFRNGIEKPRINLFNALDISPTEVAVPSLSEMGLIVSMILLAGLGARASQNRFKNSE